MKECGLSSGTPHIEGGSLCLITVGLDPEVADIAKASGFAGKCPVPQCISGLLPNLLNAQLAQQLQGAEALVCLIDFDKSKDLAVETATTLQPLVNGRTALIALSGDENPDLILNAMRAGCSEYLTKPLQADRAVELPAKIAGTLAVISLFALPKRQAGSSPF